MPIHALYPWLGDLDAAFESDDQARDAVAHFKYKRDPAYRDAVASKLVKTDFLKVKDTTSSTYQRGDFSFEEEFSSRRQAAAEEAAQENVRQAQEAASKAQENLESLQGVRQTATVPDSAKAFRNTHEMTEAMRDPRYKKDADYREHVEARIAKGVTGLTTSNHTKTVQVQNGQ
jgi:hypothetical protein